MLRLAEADRRGARPDSGHDRVDEVLRPAAAPSRRPAGVGIHVVRAKDTVSSIAKLYGVTTSDVVRWNNLENGDAIRPGDRLRVTALRPTVELDGQGGFR